MRSYTFWLSKLFLFLPLFFILWFGCSLRAHQLYTWPRTGATFDEYAWTWVGMNLIQHHIPISWSPHPQYTHAQNIMYQKAHFRIVQPWLEHPPLFGIIAGGYALLNGVPDMYHVRVENIRGLALILGVLSILLVFLLTQKLYGYTSGLLAAFLYAITPTIAVGSRLVQNENFFIPCFLLVLYLLTTYINTGKARFRNSAAVLCGLLTLAKVPWISATLAVVLIFMYLRKYTDIGKFLAVVLPIFSLFFLYGVLYDQKLFFSLWQLQLHRYDLTFSSFFALFTAPYLADRFFLDGWIYFGWFAIVLLSLKDFRKNYILLLSFLAYFAIFVAAIPNEAGHGWYRYPFYPFLTIATALFIKEYVTKNALLTFFFLMFVGLSMLDVSWTPKFGFSFLVFRFFLVLFSAPLWPLFLPRTKHFSTWITYFSCLILVLASYSAIRQYNEQ